MIDRMQELLYSLGEGDPVGKHISVLTHTPTEDMSSAYFVEGKIVDGIITDIYNIGFSAFVTSGTLRRSLWIYFDKDLRARFNNYVCCEVILSKQEGEFL